ncbi:MAG TPA: type II secretion system protein GspM [Gemmatimonadales bacterium]|nr:type II secretion system protein GspM [Gemmatimonadales bacterium]
MTPRDRRALLFGGATVFGALLALKVAPAAIQYYGVLRMRTAERVATLEQARSVLEAAPAVDASFSVAARQIVALAPALVVGESAADAAANLTSELSLVAERAGLRVVGFNALPDSARGTFAPVALRAQLEGDVKGLAGFLKAVEGGRTLLTLRSLQVQAGDPLEQQAGAEQLRLELVIGGWRLNRRRS